MESLVFFPDMMPAWAAGLVVAASFFTALLTASYGLGGGIALLAVMSALMPPLAVIPVHGLAQAGANASRFALQWRHVVWPTAAAFTVGGVIGAFIGGRVYVELPEGLLRAGVGAFVLWTVWGPKPKGRPSGAASHFATGAASAFLSMFFGATGPIAAAMLAGQGLDRHSTVATHAACMTGQHAVKAIAFGVLGFAYPDWAGMIILILIAGFLGSFVGTKILHKLPEANFQSGFRLILTTVAAYLVLAGVADVVSDIVRKG